MTMMVAIGDLPGSVGAEAAGRLAERVSTSRPGIRGFAALKRGIGGGTPGRDATR
ncbi:hypothetical protein GCM10017600_07480 [Streptosporangium carneum]|uniref:Uncharacterized protein n=1 Tax=Streptosporangium carneum TaxID=47481 RepID=A0A9W6HXD7_9ACTN|nr:hypothetical protein GCM10017600_07480 [Streptosporangium carneum]